MEWIQKRLSGTFQRPPADETPKSPTKVFDAGSATLSPKPSTSPTPIPGKTLQVPPQDPPPPSILSEIEDKDSITILSPRESETRKTPSPRRKVSGATPSSPTSSVSYLKTSGSPHKRTLSDEDSSDSQSHQRSRSDYYRKALDLAHEKLLETQREFDRRIHVLTSALEEKAEQNVLLTLSHDKFEATVSDLNSQVKSLASGNQVLEQKFESEMALTREFMNKITSLTNMIDSLSKENVKLKVEVERLNSLPPPLNTNLSSNDVGFSAKDIDRIERGGINRDDIEINIPSALALQINSRGSSNPARHTSPRYPFVNSPKFSPRGGAPFGSPGKENGFLSLSGAEMRIAELEKEVRDVKNQLLMSIAREDGLNESLDIYEKELRRVKSEARVNLDLEGFRREELQFQVKRLQQRVEELEFLVDETSETTFDASEVDDDSLEEDHFDPAVMDELGHKIETVSIPGNALGEAGPAGKSTRSPKSSPQSSRNSSPRTSIDLTRGLGGAPVTSSSNSPVIHRRGRSFDLGDRIPAFSPQKNLGGNSQNVSRRYGHQRHRSIDFESPTKAKAPSSSETEPLPEIQKPDLHPSNASDLTS